MDEKIGISPLLAGRDSHVSVQAVDGRRNHAAKVQRPSWGK